MQYIFALVAGVIAGNVLANLYFAWQTRRAKRAE
jgi:hypothetical protein